MIKKMSMKQFKALNRKKGFYSFEQRMMKFFNGRIETGMLRWGYFITSERYGCSDTSGSEYIYPRYYRIQLADFDTGVVRTLPHNTITTEPKKNRKKCINNLMKIIKKLQKLHDQREECICRIEETDQKDTVFDLNMGLSDIDDQLRSLQDGK